MPLKTIEAKALANARALCAGMTEEELQYLRDHPSPEGDTIISRLELMATEQAIVKYLSQFHVSAIET